MKENIKTLILIFSIVLNITFIGTAGYAWLSRPEASGVSETCPFLSQELNLTKEQLEQVISVRDRFRAQMSAIRNDLKAKQLGLIDLLAAQNINSGAVNSLQVEIQALQQRMQATIITHITEETKIFTAEQRGSFFRIMKERVDKQCLPLGRPSWGNRPAE